MEMSFVGRSKLGECMLLKGTSHAKIVEWRHFSNASLICDSGHCKGDRNSGKI